jgi:hypothetical protein
MDILHVNGTNIRYINMYNILFIQKIIFFCTERKYQRVNLGRLFINLIRSRGRGEIRSV